MLFNTGVPEYTISACVILRIGSATPSAHRARPLILRLNLRFQPSRVLRICAIGPCQSDELVAEIHALLLRHRGIIAKLGRNNVCQPFGDSRWLRLPGERGPGALSTAALRVIDPAVLLLCGDFPLPAKPIGRGGTGTRTGGFRHRWRRLALPA